MTRIELLRRVMNAAEVLSTAIMLTLFVLSFAAGIKMAIDGEVAGYVQTILILALLIFRLASVIKRGKEQ